nr:hypothetical protein [Treponema denticola]
MCRYFCRRCKESDGTKVVVYTTKSFAADYGPGPKIAELFKAKTGKEVEYVICKEGVLNRVILEGKASTADVLIGIDNHLIEKARKAKVKSLQTYGRRQDRFGSSYCR